MPTFTMFLIGLPVKPCHWPDLTLPAKSAIRSITSCTCATTSVPSTTSELSLGIRSATCSTERCSEVLIGSPANIMSRRSSRPDSRARSISKPIVSSVTRFLE